MGIGTWDGHFLRVVPPYKGVFWWVLASPLKMYCPTLTTGYNHFLYYGLAWLANPEGAMRPFIPPIRVVLRALKNKGPC